MLVLLCLFNPTHKGKTQNTDNNVKWLVEPVFDYAWNFSEGLAPVKIDGKIGFINKKGEFVVEPQFDFDYIWPFHEGMMRVYVGPLSENSYPSGGMYGFVNKEGDFIIEPQFDRAYDFSEGLARVEINNKWGFIKNPLKNKN